jgi:CDP-glucose 4,6-dehydratase
MTHSLSGRLSAYAGRRVLVTGHTGFKGGWLSLWLSSLGAKVFGTALAPDTTPDLFSALALAQLLDHREGDVRDGPQLARRVQETEPDVIFHLAAQPLVRRAYRAPVETFEVNVMGTAHLLEAVRNAARPCAVVVVSSDKAYENDGSGVARQEGDPLGGHDPYSASKAACELVVEAFRSSYFAPGRIAEHGVALASARAGNVIGGGDWAEDRIVPDAVRAFGRGQALEVRNPDSTRPFQHVIEPLAGYLLLGAGLLGADHDRAPLCRAWNFAPRDSATVRALVDALARSWGEGAGWVERRDEGAPHEARTLSLDAGAAERELHWSSRWGIGEAAARTAAWYLEQRAGAGAARLRALFLEQLAEWERA